MTPLEVTSATHPPYACLRADKHHEKLTTPNGTAMRAVPRPLEANLNPERKVPERKIVDMYAGPLNQWGPEKQVYAVLGSKAGCKLTVGENNTNGNIRLQARWSTDRSTMDWQEYAEGTFIEAQVVWCRLASTSSGGSVKLVVES